MVRASGKVPDAERLQALYDCRRCYRELLIAGRDARLPEVVEAPRIHCTRLVHGEVMMEAGIDSLDAVLGQTDRMRDQGLEPTSVEEAAPELALLARSPSEHVAGMSQGENVVRATRQLLDIGQPWNEIRRRLEELAGPGLGLVLDRIVEEAKKSITSLWSVRCKRMTGDGRANIPEKTPNRRPDRRW